jgi:hypothetical protein
MAGVMVMKERARSEFGSASHQGLFDRHILFQIHDQQWKYLIRNVVLLCKEDSPFKCNPV